MKHRVLLVFEAPKLKLSDILRSFSILYLEILAVNVLFLHMISNRVPSRLEFQVPHSTERPTLITNQSHIFTFLYLSPRFCNEPIKLRYDFRK